MKKIFLSILCGSLVSAFCFGQDGESCQFLQDPTPEVLELLK
jgi:hypothetical protein